MIRCATLFTTCVLLGLASRAAADTPSSTKEALQALNDFIGNWKGDGAPLKARPGPNELWKETLSWGWQLQGRRRLADAELPGRQALQEWRAALPPGQETLPIDPARQCREETGVRGRFQERGAIVLERPDADKKQTDQLTMNVAAEGVRFIYRLRHRPDGKTFYVNDYEVACTRKENRWAARKRRTNASSAAVWARSRSATRARTSSSAARVARTRSTRTRRSTSRSSRRGRRSERPPRKLPADRPERAAGAQRRAASRCPPRSATSATTARACSRCSSSSA